MSNQLVGYENLPNAFIEQIEILNHDGAKNILNFSVSVHDSLENPVWSDTEEVFNKMMRLGFVVSTNNNEAQQIINGALNPLRSQTLHTKNIGKHSFVEETKTYKFHFSKLIDNSVANLHVFAFCFIDKKQILEKMSIDVMNDYIGPIKCEKIVENGNLNTMSHVFVRQNGEYWPGPVHEHEGTFMIGSHHTDTPHEILKKIEVTNTKVKDMRNITKSSVSRQEKKASYISDIFISKSNNVDINSVFMINFRSLLKDKSLYGNFLSRAQNNVFSSLLSNFKIKSLSLVRQRIKRSRLKTKKIYSQKNILMSYDGPETLQKITRYEKNGHHDVIVDQLRSKSDVEFIPGKKEIFIEQLQSYKKIASVKEIFLDYGLGIRTFQINDYELSYNTFGEYQYKIEMIMSDPTRNFLIQTIQSLDNIISTIKASIPMIKNNKINNVTLDVDDIVNEYLKIYSYIYEINNQERDAISFKLKNMLNPNKTNVDLLSKALKIFQEIYVEMLSFLKYDKNLKNKNKKVSILSKEGTINVISIQHQFEKSFVPSDSEVSLSYLEDSKNDFVKVMTVEEVKTRATQEKDKNFKKEPKFDTKAIPGPVSAALRDIRTFEPSHFSPILLKDRDVKIRLDNNFNVPFEKFNKSINKKFLPMGKSTFFTVAPPPAPRQEFIEDDGQALVRASDTLGEDSEFVKYSEDFEDFNIIDKPLTVADNIENISAEIDTPKSTPGVFEGIKKLDVASAFSLPMQIKSILIIDRLSYLKI